MAQGRTFPVALLSACFAAIACQSGESPAGGIPKAGESIAVTIEAVTVAGLPTCNTALSGQVGYVTSTQKLYACSSSSWREITCGTSNLGAVAYSSTSQRLLACVANKWSPINASGSAGTGSGGMGAQPILTAISGTCPTFKTGTITFMGLGGIQLKVGPKGVGNGSLIFYWHGTGSNSNEFESLIPAADQNTILNAGGMIVSFQNTTGTGADCSGTAIFSQGDFTIADQIAACAVRDYSIDPRRIYTTGCSAGGLQAGCMGILRSNYIAAVATNSGGSSIPLALQNASHAPAAMTMHGAPGVDVVGVDFSQTSATYDMAIKAGGGLAIDCNHGGGHCATPSALQSSAIQFLLDHPFGVSPDPYAGGLPMSFPSYCAVK